MTPFSPIDPATQLAAIRTLISMQQDLENSLQAKLEAMRAHGRDGDRHEDAIHLLAEGQLEVLLMGVQQERMRQEANAELLEGYADYQAKNPYPSAILQAPPPALAPVTRIPTQADGLLTTTWICETCGETSKLRYSPRIPVSELMLAISHNCGAGHVGTFMEATIHLKKVDQLPEGYVYDR
jgi:hypothetical protein